MLEVGIRGKVAVAGLEVEWCCGVEIFRFFCFSLNVCICQGNWLLNCINW